MQQFGLQLLIEEDARVLRDEKTERIKQAAMASGHVAPHLLYPAFFLPPEDEETVEDGEGSDFTSEEATPDYSSVKWEVPSEADDPDGLLDQLDVFNNLTLLESEVGEDEGGEWL